MQATHIRRLRNAAPSIPGRQSTPGVAAARRTANGALHEGVGVGPGEHVSVTGSGGDCLPYYGCVHVHRSNPVLAHDGLGLVLQKRDTVRLLGTITRKRHVVPLWPALPHIV